MDPENARAFLAALQVADSFFPTGMFVHSQGLEGMAQRGWIAGAADLEEWLHNQLVWAVLPSDGVALLHTHRAATAGDMGTVLAIDRLLAAMKLPAELRAASQHGGSRLLAESGALAVHPFLHDFRRRVQAHESPGNAAVAFGVAAAALGIGEMPALLAFCHSYAVGVLGAAMRLLRLTHTETQGVLFRTNAVVAQEAMRTAGRHWSAMTAFTPQLDLAAMLHETSDLRMFAS